MVDGNINPYCSLDEDGRRPLKELTLGEKEQLFLNALSVRRRGGLQRWSLAVGPGLQPSTVLRQLGPAPERRRGGRPRAGGAMGATVHPPALSEGA